MMKLYSDKEWLYEQYTVRNRSVKDIASECGLSTHSIKKYLSIYGIKRKKEELKYWQTKEWLIENYVNTDKLIRTLGAEIGVHYTTLSSYINKYKLNKGHFPDVDYEKLNDYNWLKEQYLINNRSMSDIAKELNCTVSTVNRRLGQFSLLGIKSALELYTKGIDNTQVDFSKPEFCYIAGLLSVDGHIVKGTRNVILQLQKEQSEAVLKQIHKFLKAEKELKSVTAVRKFNGDKEYETHALKLDITLRELVDALNSFGMYHLKNQEVRFPDDIDSWSEDCQRMFIRGIMDGDGTAEYGARIALFLRSPSYGTLKEFWGYIDRKFGVTTEVMPFKTQNGTQMWYVYMNKNLTIELFKWMYRGYPEFRIEYKFNKFVTGCKNHGIEIKI